MLQWWRRAPTGLRVGRRFVRTACFSSGAVAQKIEGGTLPLTPRVRDRKHAGNRQDLRQWVNSTAETFKEHKGMTLTEEQTLILTQQCRTLCEALIRAKNYKSLEWVTIVFNDSLQIKDLGVERMKVIAQVQLGKWLYVDQKLKTTSDPEELKDLLATVFKTGAKMEDVLSTSPEIFLGYFEQYRKLVGKQVSEEQSIDFLKALSKCPKEDFSEELVIRALSLLRFKTMDASEFTGVSAPLAIGIISLMQNKKHVGDWKAQVDQLYDGVLATHSETGIPETELSPLLEMSPSDDVTLKLWNLRPKHNNLNFSTRAYSVVVRALLKNNNFDEAWEIYEIRSENKRSLYPDVIARLADLASEDGRPKWMLLRLLEENRRAFDVADRKAISGFKLLKSLNVIRDQIDNVTMVGSPKKEKPSPEDEPEDEVSPAAPVDPLDDYIDDNPLDLNDPNEVFERARSDSEDDTEDMFNDEDDEDDSYPDEDVRDDLDGYDDGYKERRYRTPIEDDPDFQIHKWRKDE
jgi:pentatricopeptide repeat protein